MALQQAIANKRLVLMLGSVAKRFMSTTKHEEWNPQPGYRVKRKVHDARVHFPEFLKQPKVCQVIGAPMTLGQPKAGTDNGPAMLRNMGLKQELEELQWKVEDVGDLEMIAAQPNDEKLPKEMGSARNVLPVGRSCEIIHTAVHKAAQEGKFALTLGGDHAIGAGTCAGILKARPDTGIIWVDAHADINTPQTTNSGNMHGMPLALVMQLFDPRRMPGWSWLHKNPVLPARQIVYIGLRDVDEGERVILRQHGILAFTMFHVDKYGIGGVMERTLDHLDHRPLHLSYDIDAVDPLHAPATGTTVRGGLTFREAHYVAETVSGSGMLGSLDMVEVNPSLGTGADVEQTLEMGLALISSAMGSRII